MNALRKCLALPLLVLALHQGQAVAGDNLTPKEVTSTFYGWYVDQYLADHTPVEDNAPDLMRYVSEKALGNLTALMQRPQGQTEDYFLKSNDNGESWKGNVTVTEQSATDTTAFEKVVVGLNYLDKKEVQVALEKEVDGWRIVAVTDLQASAD
ncbi:DUF3828 domain-containing protein [Pseudomonas fluorescens]|uniref:DUF3828 domain-containing protein n=1 Tax=Pseudomonas fluorescens TaxID=294 RepID=UPI001930A31A|nr:DUF3828 domain-containing protein [Pseudomonas fluorescens]MBD8088825.1 DUF3828 domain-containing protein [Pseudomonas fluorescens]